VATGEDRGGAGGAPSAAGGAILRRLDRELITRIWRGHHPVRSEDVTMVPKEPNFIGTFTLTSHSGPWDYLQNIPLVLYGPGYIEASGAPLEDRVHITDVYPTIGRLVGVDLAPRAGRVLTDALAENPPGAPKLVVVVVWDGAGRSTLERWPRQWPNLRRLGRAGTSYANALVGSSPSITSVVHASLGTGAWARRHGVTGNTLRGRDGSLRETFAGRSVADLELSTFADQADLAFGNAARVGLLAWKQWHLPMMSHGAAAPGGDHDELALIAYDGEVRVSGNSALFATPPGLGSAADIHDHVERLDRRDGRVDGRWRGHRITPEGKASWTTYSNPAWADYEADLALEMLRRGGYGQDSVPDFFFVNYKMTDLAAHQWGIDAPETADVLRAQDAALGSMLRYLDRHVDDYVVVVTSDHGNSLSPRRSGAWPIVQTELVRDVDVRFGAPDGSSLVADTAAYGLYLNRPLMHELGVTAGDVAEFLSKYTVADNWTDEDLPPGYGTRGEETVFSAVFPSALVDEAVRRARAAGNGDG
jgi:predicted AlkP superfamily pyrophosphatase or phosphodiesterase